jgi:hypothetical protein
MEYGIIVIAILLPIPIVLLFIVLDKNFKGYTRTIPVPPKTLKLKYNVKNKKTSVHKSKSSKQTL